MALSEALQHRRCSLLLQDCLFFKEFKLLALIIPFNYMDNWLIFVKSSSNILSNIKYVNGFNIKCISYMKNCSRSWQMHLISYKIICQVIKNIAIEISQYPEKFNIKSTSLIVQPVIEMLSLFLLLKTYFFSSMKQKMTLDRINNLLFSIPQMWMWIYTAK